MENTIYNNALRSVRSARQDIHMMMGYLQGKNKCTGADIATRDVESKSEDKWIPCPREDETLAKKKIDEWQASLKKEDDTPIKLGESNQWNFVTKPSVKVENIDEIVIESDSESKNNEFDCVQETYAVVSNILSQIEKDQKSQKVILELM